MFGFYGTLFSYENYISNLYFNSNYVIPLKRPYQLINYEMYKIYYFLVKIIMKILLEML